MRDCPNAEMRDALPDLMHGTLPARRSAEILAHVDQCEMCRAELALLRRVRGAVTAPVPATDRIVASLPAYRPRSAGQRLAGAAAWRIAAVIVVLAGGASLLLRAGRTSTDVVPDTAAPPAAIGAPVELAVGETFADISDSALVALVEAMTELDATLSEEPEAITVPLSFGEGL
jgi:hypothetical protein